MQLQSATDPPKKIVLGERMLAADGTEYVMLQEKEAGRPIEIVYPSEGTPLIVGPNADVQGRAQSERGAAAAGLDVLRRNASSFPSTTAGCARCMRRRRKSRAARRSPRSS